MSLMKCLVKIISYVNFVLNVTISQQAQSSGSPTLSRNTSDTNLSSDSGVPNTSATTGVINTDSELKQALFTRGTKAIVWGMQSKAVQGMLDFDYSCSRSSPSVVAMVYPFV